jgi:hypothetical protein
VAPRENVRIYIDGEPVEAREEHLTGGQIRALTTPAPENLWLDVKDAQDHSVEPLESVAIVDGMRFFTDRPRTIYIDKAPYEVRTGVLTAAELRALPSPPVPDDYGIWKDIPDDLDDPIEDGELVTVANGDRFFTKPLPKRDVHITVNRRTVTLNQVRQTGQSIKEAAIAQGVPIHADFLLSRKEGQKFKAIPDTQHLIVHEHDEFRANDGDDNS